MKLRRQMSLWQRASAGRPTLSASLCLALVVVFALHQPGPVVPAAPASPTDGLYLADGNASPGTVYRLESDGSLTTYYTRPAGPLTHFAFSPTGDLYYLDVNGTSIYTSTSGREQVHFTHTTNVKDLAFGTDELLYFSDAMGGGGDGHIWRLVGGFAGWVPELFYTVSLASVNGYWRGDFAFDSAGTLYLSSGNRSGAALYRVQPDGTPQQIYQQDDELDGFAVDATGAFYFTTRVGGIFRLMLGGSPAPIWSIPAGSWVWDINLVGRVGPTPAPTETPTATRPPADTPTSTVTPSATATTIPAATASVTPTPTATSDSTLTAPKWLESPGLDGQCGDAEYAQAGTVSLLTPDGGAGGEVKLLHSGLDLYVCFAAIPSATGQRALVRVDSDHSRSRLIMPGDYELSVTAGGVISVTQGNTTGTWSPMSVPAGDFAAVVASSGRDTWNAELRISLEWVGGYARTDGLSLAVEQADGAPLQQWPPSAAPQLPATWGDLVLAPLYTDSVVAGSAFLDGREGYLVVPYAPDLNPSEITIEAWGKVVDGDCGTLVGNGRDVSYWLAFCQMIQFGHDGADSVNTGQHPPGDGWHHVAVAMDAARGIRTFYLDGEVDARFGWEPAHEEREGEKEPERLGISDRMLRIGSDRNAPGEVDRLHGYVSELRIWNRVRTADEIRSAAFRRLGGSEDGLVALWPFTNGLHDVAGGHDAGLVGNASLAREARDVAAFPSTPTPAPYTYPTPGPIPAWESHVPASAGKITLDGVCRPAEYPDDSTLTMEPDRYTSMHLLVARDALYLCTNILWGGHGLDSAVTLWINRDGQGGAAPGPADLRLRLLPDGSLAAGTGDGRDYNAPAPTVFASQIISDTRFALQEDIRTVDSPWWAGEVRIPLEALAPYTPGQPLRLALSYEGTVAAGAFPDQVEDVTVTGDWPASFDPQRPDTWGEATTDRPPHNLYLPLVGRQYAGPRSAEEVGRDASAGDASEAGGLIVIMPEQAQALRAQQPGALAGWPRNPPTENDFNNHCPGGISTPAYAFNKGLKWPRVDPTNFPVAQAEGTLDSIEISKEDSPFIHSSHDLDMKATIRQADRWLVIGGGSSLVLETESGPFKADAMPVPGDHVTVQGRWIFDCGHAPKTEIHPIPIFESDRLVTLPDGIGSPGKRKTVRVARVWMNSQPGAFQYTFGGPFTFSVDLPGALYGGDKLLFLRVVDGPANKVAVTGLTNTTAQITITPPGSSGQYYFELMLGYLDAPNPASAAGLGYTVTLNKIWIYDDHDAGFPDCHGPNDCGEWTMFVALNDTWRKVFVNKTVWDEHDHADYAVNLSIPVLGTDLRFRVIGYEDDDPFAGDWITRGEWNHGSLASLCCGVQQSAWHDDWRIFYTVTSGYAGLTALPQNDSWYWAFRLANEPNDPVRDDLGTLPVPAEGAPAHVTEKNAFLTQSPLHNNGVYVLRNDVDRYKFALADFADVSFGNLPYGVHVHVDQTFPWTYAGKVPPVLANLGVYKSAWINVHGDSPAVTDKLYTLKVYTSWRPLPPDWGENQDTLNAEGVGGRLVDLLTPDPDTKVTDETILAAASRSLTKDWAWQHVTGDVDYYDAWIPPVKEHPPLQPFTECDTPGRLKLYAYDMHLQVVAPSGIPDLPILVAEGDDSVEVTNLNAQFPSGHVYVRVKSITGQRGFYRLRAEWYDAHYYTLQECAFLKALLESLKEFGYPIPFPKPLPWPGPDPIIDHLALFGLGGYKLVALEQGNTLAAIVSSAADQPVIARLYGMDGVLLGEGVALGEASVGEGVPDGQIPRHRLTFSRLSAGEHYLLQIVPAFDVGPTGVQQTTVGFTQPAPGESATTSANRHSYVIPNGAPAE